MKKGTETLPGSDFQGTIDADATMVGSPQPGLVLVYSGLSPQWAVLPLVDGQLEVGREILRAVVEDGRISRRHASIHYKDGRVVVLDHGSRNGTAVDGRSIAPNAWEPVERCLRIGETLFLPVADVRPLQRCQPMVQDGRVVGPRLVSHYLEIARIAQASNTLHVSGGSGSGKEDAARAFHRASPASHGPFVAVNCATIPESIAERLLFGAKRGAYSSANADVGGYVQAADGGTLFLDEVTELHAAVQAKLLRVLESREILPVGSSRPVPVDLRICSASHVSLRDQVAAGRLREDLYYRLGRPEITLPPLRERLEEVPWLIELEIGRRDASRRPHFTFVEACLLRHWPGNIRELLTEVNTAVQTACAKESLHVTARHLHETAGQLIKPASADTRPVLVDAASAPLLPPVVPKTAGTAKSNGEPTKRAQQRAELEDVLRRTGGNVSRAAQAMGLDRTTLRRLLKRHLIEPARIPGIISRESVRNHERDS
jgi:DNA-binding NtrC family response regulator